MDALADNDVRRRLEDLGQVIPPPEQQTAEAFGAYHKAEIKKRWPVTTSNRPPDYSAQCRTVMTE
jgi:hypothetical protein